MRQEHNSLAQTIENLKSSDQARVAVFLEQLYMSGKFRYSVVKPQRARVTPEDIISLNSVYVAYFDEITWNIRFLGIDFAATAQEETKRELELVKGIVESLPGQPFTNARDPLARQLITDILLPQNLEVIAGVESSKKENGERVVRVLWPRGFREALGAPERLKDDSGLALACMFLKMGNYSLEPPTSIILPKSNQ
ncbi:MAG: hypothetical protein AAB694_02120 [Patescibacteria group bacterium]